MHRALAAAWLLSIASCRAQTDRAAEPSPPIATSALMHANFTAVRDIYQALVVDDLTTAQARARELGRIPSRGDSEDWTRAAHLLRAQAVRLSGAPTASGARRLSTAMATYCADCHMFRADPSLFRAADRPPDDGSVRAAMARHVWGADTLWLGVIAPSSDLWNSGLSELSAAPRVQVDGERAGEVEVLNARLAALARLTGDHLGQNDRAARLAEILDVCAACHAITRR